jgi:hypothetical protein
MKPYVELDCPDFNLINQSLIEYIYNYTKLTTKNDKHQYCNFIYDVKHLLQYNPLLANYLRSIRLQLRDFYFTLSWEFPGLGLHIDKPPVNWKCNWPIINFKHSIMQFWALHNDVKNLSEYVIRTGNPNSKDNDHYLFQIEDFQLTHEYQFNERPILINGSIPHSVRYLNEQQFPRIGLQLMFFKEPLHLI